MGTVAALKIDKLGGEVTHGTLLIGHLGYRHIGEHRDTLIGIKEDMKIAVEQTTHTGSIRKD